MRKASCMIRGPRSPVIMPIAELTWSPVDGSNCAVLLTLDHCGWLNVLYVSTRNGRPASRISTPSIEKSLELTNGYAASYPLCAARLCFDYGSSRESIHSHYLGTITFASFSSPTVTVVYSRTPRDRSRI